jgi:hypothetical protein
MAPPGAERFGAQMMEASLLPSMPSLVLLLLLPLPLAEVEPESSDMVIWLLETGARISSGCCCD